MTYFQIDLPVNCFGWREMAFRVISSSINIVIRTNGFLPSFVIIFHDIA